MEVDRRLIIAGLTGAGLASASRLAEASSPVPLRVVRQLRQGQDATILVCSDSTGAGRDRWVYKLGARIASMVTGARVIYSPWDKAADAYAKPEQVAAGRPAGPTLHIYNAAVPGAQILYQHGYRFGAAYGSRLHADLIIINHGHNHDWNWPPRVHAARMIAAAQQIALAHPSAEVMIVAQNPRRDNDNGLNRSTGAMLAGKLMGWPVADAYTLFMAAGRPASWYGKGGADPVHPSTQPGGGDDQVLDRAIMPVIEGRVGRGPRQPLTLSKRPQALLRVSSTSSIARTFADDTCAPLRGKWCSVTVRMQVGASDQQGFTPCDLLIDGKSNRGYAITAGNGRGGPFWAATSAFVPANAQSVEARFGMSGGQADAQMLVDRGTLTASALPFG